MWAVIQAIRLKFNDVNHLSTDEVAEKLKTNPSPVFFDCRAPIEFEISHLPNAISVDPSISTEALKELFENSMKKNNCEIICYCSVGYRSSEIARKLIGLKNENAKIYNMEGSIFKWANENRPMVTGSNNQQTTNVHPYNHVWGRLLEKNRWKEN